MYKEFKCEKCGEVAVHICTDKRTRKIPTPKKQCIENELQAFLEDLGYKMGKTYNMNGTYIVNFSGRLKSVRNAPKENVHIEIVDWATWTEE